MMKKYTLLLLILVTTGCLVGLIVFRERAKDEWKEFVLDGVAKNRAIAVASSNAFGRHTVFLDRELRWAPEMQKHLKIVNADGAPDELIRELVATITLLISTYADGSFGAITNFYLGDRCRINTNVLFKVFRYLKSKEGENWYRIDHFEYFPPAGDRVEKPSPLASPTKEILDMCAYVYTNTIIKFLLNEMAMQSFERVTAKAGLSSLTGQELIRQINVDLALQYEKLKSQDVKEYSVPWEELSLEFLQVTVRRGGGEPPQIVGLNQALLNGLQMNRKPWYSYSMSPDELYRRDGYVWYAVFQFAVRPRRMSYYGPVTVLFYYNAPEGRWRVLHLVCHSHITASVPL